jgi:hypothetical protein
MDTLVCSLADNVPKEHTYASWHADQGDDLETSVSGCPFEFAGVGHVGRKRVRHGVALLYEGEVDEEVVAESVNVGEQPFVAIALLDVAHEAHALAPPAHSDDERVAVDDSLDGGSTVRSGTGRLACTGRRAAGDEERGQKGSGQEKGTTAHGDLLGR